MPTCHCIDSLHFNDVHLLNSAYCFGGSLTGSELRLLLLLGWAGLVMALLPGPSVSELIQALVQGVRRHPASALAVLLSLEASVWLHLLLDGDPWPSEWRRQRRR